MSFDVLLLIGASIGFVLVLMVFVFGRKEETPPGPGQASSFGDVDAVEATATTHSELERPEVQHASEALFDSPDLAGDDDETSDDEDRDPAEEDIEKPSTDSIPSAEAGGSAAEEPVPSPADAVSSLSDTVAMLRQLAELKAEELGQRKPAPAIPVAPQPEPILQSPAEVAAREPQRASAAQRIAELKDQELERDTAVREEERTGWRPVSADPDPGTFLPDPGEGARVVSGSAVSTPADASTETELPPIVTKVSQVRLDPSTKMHPDSAAKLRLSVGHAFSPAAPVSRRDLFAGREEQLETLVDAVFERGQHAIVYGERGVGKTSLASVLTLVFADEPGRFPLRINCDAGDDYDSLWRKVFEELETGLDALGQDLPLVQKALDRALQKPKLAPTDVARVFKQVGPYLEVIIVIDEFDTCSTESTTRLFADTIKTLSDQLVPATLVLLGIADSLDELLAEHASVSRALVHVYMPRMSVPELKDIVKRGLHQLTMDIEEEAIDLIARVSQGFPHFTHLLSHSAARSAIDAERPLVTLEDVDTATTKISSRIETWIQDAYEKATTSSHDSIYAQVLLASALAPIDRRGLFAAADVRRPLTEIMGKPYDIPSFIRQLNGLAEAERGPVLARMGTERKYRYRFVEPQMEPYVIIRSMSDGLISPGLLGRLANEPTRT